MVILYPVLESKAQYKKPEKNIWVNVGLGYSSYKDFYVPGNINLIFNPGNNLFVLQFMTGGTTDFSLMYGKSLNGNFWKTGFSAGLGVLYIKDDSKVYYNLANQRKTVICLPAAVQFIYTPADWLGFGLYPYLNINTIKPFIGINLMLSIGKINY